MWNTKGIVPIMAAAIKNPAVQAANPAPAVSAATLPAIGVLTMIGKNAPTTPIIYQARKIAQIGQAYFKIIALPVMLKIPNQTYPDKFAAFWRRHIC